MFSYSSISIFVVLTWGLMGFSGFSYLGILLLLENLNVFILFQLILGGHVDQFLKFLIFIVVATMEVTLGLVMLTRLWNKDSLQD